MLISKPQLYESSMSRNLHNHANHPHPPSYPDHQLQHRGHVSHASKHGGASKFGMASTHGQNSTMGNADSMLNFYPHLLQPTRMSEAVGAGSSNASSNRSPSTRMSLKNAATLSTAKTVSFYRSGDVHMQAFKVAITKRHFRTFDSLLEALSDRIPLPFGVRTVSTPNGAHGISRLDEFEDGKSYVCSDKKTVKPLNLNAVRSTRPPWFISKPRTRNRVVAQLVRPADSESFRVPLRLTQVKTPKKIVIVRNGDPSFRHTLLLSRRTPQSFESIMEDIGEIFRMRAHKLFTTDGRRVDSLQSLFLGPNVYVAAGREAFQPMEYRMKKVAITDEKRDPLTGEMDLIKERFPKELKKTKGKWRVTVATSELPAAGTDSRVMINVYGVKGNSGPILLSDGNKSTFRSGNEDDFVIHVGSIGDIRKIRIAHDNSGTSPGWLCDSVTLTDVTTGDKLDFHCNKWLSRDEDDGEICREIAAHLPEKPVLPEITYVVSVTTGNLWNAGTDAEVLLTLYGELGDCGPRLLQHGGKSQPQVKGTTDVFRMRAVTLGNLFRVVVGHDCQDSGGGWFLERITVKEDRVGSEEWIFECNRWLDAGEDDQKTVRELYSEPDAKIMQPSRGKSQAEKLKDDMWWDLEKWKFQRGNQVVLMNHATLKAVRVRSDAGIDALGDPSHPQCAFEVLRRRSNVRVFSNVVQPSFHIALDQNRMLGQGKGGTFCEFHVKVQRDRSVLLESCKYAGQHATFDPSGKAADTRGNANIPGRTFTVYVKGCFRHDSLVMLNTSPTQALAVASSGDVIGTGRRSEVDIVGSKRSGNETRLPRQLALFRVVKVAEGVRMFQCEEDRRKFLRIKDGQCDGLGSGDVYCHFKVQKYKIGGYVTLQSMKNRGVFVGLNTNGRARPTVDTGDANTQFFPEVVKFGVRRTAKADQWITPEPSFVMSAREAPKPPSSQRIVSPEKPKPSPTQVTLKEREDSNTGPKDGDYRVYVTTGNSGSIETVTLFVYGDRGQSDAIILGKGTEGGVFQCGQTDEFQVNLATVGAVRKIRIGMEECSPDCDWRLKQVKMKDMTSNEILRFKFNRWLSRTRDDGATVRELPATAQDGSPALPVMRYLVMVRTGKGSPPPSSKSNKPPPRNELGDIPEPEVYLCMYGENYDTGRRLLMRRPPQTPESGRESQKPLFAPGQVDRFEIEAVSLGELTKCVISCPKTSQRTAPPTPWLCDEIVIRESDGASSEFVFPCKKWLGARKPKAKTQISINLGEKREVKRKQSESTEHEVGDWKVSVTTGTQENAGTSANVMFVAYSSDGTSSDPVLLGSGANGLFERGTTERFKVNLIRLDDLYKIRLSQDASGAHPSWYVERVKLKDMSSDVTYTLEVNKWISMYEEPHQMAAEIPIPKPGEELSPVYMYKVLVYTGGILGSDTEANVFISIHGAKGDTGRRPLHRSLNHDVKFQESQIDIFEVEAVDLGDLLKIEIGHDGVGPGNGWFLHKVIIKESDISQKDYIFFLNRWLDDGQDDGKIERIIEVERHAQYIASRRAVGSSAHSTPEATSRARVTWSPGVADFSSDQVYPKSSSCASSAQGATSGGTGPAVANSDPTWRRSGAIPRHKRSASYRNSRLLMRLASSTRFRGKISRSDGNTTSESSAEEPLPSTTPSSPLRDLLPTLYAWQPPHPRIDEGSSPGYLLLSPAEGDSSSRPSPTVRTRRGDALRKVNSIMGLAPLDSVLTPPDFSEPQDTTTEGEYKVYITTGSQSSDEPCPSDTLVSMVIYGDDGKTGQILLQPAPSRQSERADSPRQANLFQPGQTDEFKIEVPEIGSIYKVRISINEECDWRGIFLDRILLVKSSSKRETLFVCNRWLSAVEDDQETVREFPVTTEGEQQLPVHPYFVTVTTGDRPAGDTDANVFVTLRGERGDTGRRRLNQLRPDAHTFQRGKATSFTLEAVDLGRLQEIIVSHDGKGYGSGWFLERITVREQEFAALEWLFPCRMWLDDHVGDCKTVRRLALLGTCEVATGEEELIKLRAPPSSGESLADAEANLYAVAVSVGEVMTQGNDAVTLRGYVEGAEGNAGPFSLGEWIPGREKEFEADVKMEGVGEINKLRVEMQESDRDLNLYLLDVTVRDHRTNDVLSFSFHRRFRTSTGCTVRELPALRSNREYQNLVTYAVNVDMSPSNEDVGADGNLSLMLTGEAGTSGYRTLFRRTDGFKATKREKGYTFEMTAVDLGRLTAASIVYTTDESSASEGGWNVEAISVKVPDLPNFFAGECKPEPTFSATVRHEFTSIAGVSRVEKEYRLDEFEAGRELNRTFRKASAARPRRNVKSPDVPSAGEWSVSLTAAKYNENSIFNRISARVFGTRGCSNVIDVSHDVTRERVSQYDNPELTTRAVDVKLAEELGQLYMIRLTISKESDVRIYKVKLKDNATEQEYLSHITAQQRLHAEADDAGCLCFDLPLLRPDEEPLTHQKYDVCVKTGTHPASCTGADVRLNLVGATSETGFRPLAALCDDPDTLYGLGQMDRFAIETADVGEPRKVVVAHDGAGRGAGWFLDDVTVSQRCAGVDSDFRFFFNKWLDDSVDDKLTEREANVAATRILQPEVDASTLKGKWKCELISREELVKQKSYDVRICYCFAGGRTRDVVRQVTKATEDFDVILIEEQTESQDGDLDAQPEEEEEEEEVFVKIRAEVESSNEAIRKRWPLEEMLMSNQSTQEKLRFLFDDVPTWEGSLRGHVRELPVWRSNQTPLPVVEYYVVFNTSNDSSPDSRPGLVTIQLQGKGGATGWRKIVTPENAENRFQPGRIDVFTIEAVDLGDSVECVSVNVGGPLDQPWSLEKVKVKRGFYADQEQIFECAREIREDEVVDLTDPRMSSCAPVPSLRKSAMTAVANVTYEVAVLWSGLEESLARKEDSPGGSREALPPVHVQLVGSKGLGDLASLDLSEAKQGKRKRWTSNVKVEVVVAKFGDLRKIGIGFLEVVDPRHSALKLHKLEIVNLQNNDHYSFRPDHSFVGEGSERETGLNWMELVAVLPRQDSNSILNVVDYHVTIRTTDRESAGTDADVYVTLAGSNGDSGKRWMMRTLDGETPSFTPGASDMFKITSVDLGTLKEVTIGRNGRQTSAGWHLADVTVTSSLDPVKKLFVCGQWLSNLESESFIERVLKLRETPESPLEDAVLS